MAISLISTVKNEESSIGAFLASVERQTQPPDEIVLVDGGSTDRTVEIIRSFKSLPIRVLVEPCNIARGRNLAIAAAQFEFVVVTDAGCTLHPDWLQLLASGATEADVVVGNYRPKLRTLFDACQYSLVGLFKNDQNLKRFCISSRSLAFHRQVWREAGGYPEWLNYSEDMYFHERLRANRYRFHFAPKAIVEWEQRSSMAAVYRQYFRYMEGDGLARMHTNRHLFRFLTYSVGVVLSILSFVQLWLLLPLILGSALYLSVPLRAFVRLQRYPVIGPALVIIPVLLLVMDVAKMLGYLSGLFASFRLVPATVRDSSVS